MEFFTPLNTFQKEITHHEKHLNWFWIVCNRCCGCSLPRSRSLRPNRQGSTCRSSCDCDLFITVIAACNTPAAHIEMFLSSTRNLGLVRKHAVRSLNGLKFGISAKGRTVRLRSHGSLSPEQFEAARRFG